MTLRKKIRKGQPIKNRLKKFKIYYLNIRGIKSKVHSLHDVIDEIQPTLFGITETHLIKKIGLDIEGYEIYRNDRDQDGGGILFGIQKRLKYITTIVQKQHAVEENLWLVIDNKQVAIRVGIIYAPQESRTSIEKYEEMYKNIESQILLAKQNNQKLLMLGDFNCKIGELIKGNTKEVSKSGKLFIEMVEKNKLLVLNTTDCCEGIWTREEGESKSVLDYVIVDQGDEHAVVKMMVDEGKEFAPAKSKEDVTSDHNAIRAEMNWLIDSQQKRSTPRTTISKKGYQKIKDEIKDGGLVNIFKKDEPIEILYQEFKGKVDQIVENNLTTVKSNNKRKSIRMLIRAKKCIKKEIKKKGKKLDKNSKYILVARMKILEEAIKDEGHKQYKQKIEKVVERLKGRNGINTPNMWEIMKQIERKKVEPPTAIKSKVGEVIEEPEKIRERYLEHFGEVLQNVPAETEEEKNQEDFIEEVFKKIMLIAEKRPTRYTTMDEMQAAVKELKRKKSKDKSGWNNDFVIETGEEMLECLLALVNKIEERREIPKDWNEVRIKTVHKKGSVLLLDNKRGLFLTDILSKIYEKVEKNRNQEKIADYVSDLQTGGTKERATVDNFVILSEVIRRKRKLGKKCYLLFGDAVKCFDKLWLKDSLVELYKAGCDLQDIQMIYKMNKDTIIEVETPSGMTDKLKVGEIVKQGTVLGPTLCCVTTDQINNIGESQERNLGCEIIGILVFVDDVMSAGDAEDVRKGIRNCRAMEKLKKTTYGLKKTKYMVMNTGREKEEIIEESVKEGVVQKTNEYEYLGFHLNEQGNCMYHILKKGHKMAGQVVALKSMASYGNVGSKFVVVRLELYELSIIPSLLYGIEAWNKQSKRELQELEKQQAKALCSIMELPRSTPYMGLLNELGIWKIEHRLNYRRIMLVQNILKSDDRRLCKRLLKEQEKEDEDDDTLYATTKKALEKYGIDIRLIENMTKSELKRRVKSRIEEEMEESIQKAAENMTKMRFMRGEKFERKAYVKDMGGHDSLQVLKTRLNMQPVFKNYKGDITMTRHCPYCMLHEDDTEHLVECDTLGNTMLRGDNMKNTDNTELWRQLNERVKFNINNRPKN